ncbi:phosphoribosylamine--glycine ligase [Roseiflexus castenholzii]|uniref:phosphoribosylamine--glycine ligase n=1 Tax=Roseiflexus castenholzii TaxID=120962 RepID=UPI003C7D8813
MNVLLVGSGGREHALAWKLAQSPLIDTLFVAPGNPGTAQIGRNLPVEAFDIPRLVEVAQCEQIDLVVVGPEAPLAAGLADACLKAGIPVFGPTAAAAQIESSKAFAKRLMIEAGIPTAEAHIFDDPDSAADFVRTTGRAWVVKADGLAAGKGVIVPESVGDTLDAIRMLSATRAGARLVLEERLSGPEVSLIALCAGERALPLPPAQDHKRLRDGDAGPNTGGMGAYAPAPHLTPADVTDLTAQIILPALRALQNARTPFCGALYAGLILTEQGPRVLEFNARFGDPETQAILPLLDGDLLAALAACAGNGALSDDMLRGTNNAAACVVLAAEGYPDTPRRGDVISGIASVNDPRVVIFHAGTAWKNGQLTTAGGRVLGVTGVGPTLREALARAYAAVDRISFPGMQYRRDIGAKAIQ